MESEPTGGRPDEAVRTVKMYVTCSPCRRCGTPYYVDGCLKCGYGIDGNFGNEKCD